MSKPTIVMVPGAWHKPSVYSEVAAALEKHGYPTVSLALPSVGAIPPHKDFNGDVAAIRNCVTELVSDGKEVVLVVHSYGGFPGGEAPKGLGKKECEVKGLKGGVIRYVVINGVAMPEGYQPHATGDYSQMPSWIEKDIEVRLPPNFIFQLLTIIFRTILAPSLQKQRKSSSTTTSLQPKPMSCLLSLFTKASAYFSVLQLMQLGRIFRLLFSLAMLIGPHLVGSMR
jgi:pimeloyl-ACP methyl ester carboxylesterase